MVGDLNHVKTSLILILFFGRLEQYRQHVKIALYKPYHYLQALTNTTNRSRFFRGMLLTTFHFDNIYRAFIFYFYLSVTCATLSSLADFWLLISQAYLRSIPMKNRPSLLELVEATSTVHLQIPPVRNLTEPEPFVPYTPQNHAGAPDPYVKPLNASQSKPDALWHKEKEYHRHQFGKLFRDNLFSSGRKLNNTSKISSEDVNEAILYLWKLKKSPKRPQAFYTCMADYLNRRHDFDRERQKKAADLRGVLRRLRYNVMLNPDKLPRTVNQHRHLRCMKVNLATMVAAVRMTNEEELRDHRLPDDDYMDALATNIVASPRKAPQWLDPLLDPVTVTRLKAFEKSLVG